MRSDNIVNNPSDSLSKLRKITNRLCEKDKQLKQSAELYRTLFRESSDAIVLIDVQSGDIVDFNDSVCQGLGYTREEFEKLSVLDIEMMETEEDFDRHIRQIVDNGKDVFWTKHRRKDGRAASVKVISSFISVNGTHNFIQSVWQYEK